MEQFVYNGPPVEPAVPVIRYWLPQALVAWTRTVYGRRGWFFAFGWLFFVLLIWVFLKFVVYWGGVVAIFALFALTAAFDLVSYPLRKR